MLRGDAACRLLDDTAAPGVTEYTCSPTDWRALSAVELDVPTAAQQSMRSVLSARACVIRVCCVADMARQPSRGLRYMVIGAPAATLPSEGTPRRTIFAPPQIPSASLACHVINGSQRNTYLNPLRNLRQSSNQWWANLKSNLFLKSEIT